MRNISLLLLILAAVTFCSCSSKGQDAVGLEHEQEQLLAMEDSLAFKVGVTPTLDCLPFFVIKEYNIIDSTEVDIHLQRYVSQMDCDTAIMRNRVEMTVSDIVRVERMKAYGVAVDYLTGTNAKWYLYGNAKSGLADKDSLDGKKIALTRFSATSLLTSSLLKSINMTDDNVFLIQVNDVNIRMQMLRNNELDAFWLTEPQAAVARMENHPLLWSGKELENSLGVIAYRHNIKTDTVRLKQFNLLAQAYNIACDTINRLGLNHFSSVISKYCNVSAAVVDSLPAMEYNHITLPQERDITAARTWLRENGGMPNEE